MKKINIIILLLVLLLTPAIGFAQSYSDYLIMQNINPYRLEAAQKVVGGYIGGPRVFDGAGAIAPTDHFYPDHTDKTYEAYYEGGSTLTSATVQVTKHSGSDSDKWLAHEVERGFRDTDKLESSPDENSKIREVNGHKMFFYGGGVVGYRWLSNNIVVNIQYQ